MGEPVPGDIPDPIYLKTTNALLQADQVNLKGGYITYDTNADFWRNIGTGAERLVGESIVQLQEDVDSTGFVAGAVNTSAFGNGSWIYAFLAGDCDPESPVILVVFTDGGGNKAVGFTNSITVEGDVEVVSNVATMTTDADHGYTVGERVTIVSASLDESGESVLITSIVSPTVFTFTTTSGDFTTETATSTYDAANNHRRYKYIKRSGDTFAQKGFANEVGVIALTGVGA